MPSDCSSELGDNKVLLCGTPYTLVTTYREGKRETQMIASFLWQHEVWPQGGGFRFTSSRKPQSLVSKLVLSNREFFNLREVSKANNNGLYVRIFLDSPDQHLKRLFLMPAARVFVRQSDANVRFLLSSGDAVGFLLGAMRGAAVGTHISKVSSQWPWFVLFPSVVFCVQSGNSIHTVGRHKHNTIVGAATLAHRNSWRVE